MHHAYQLARASPPPRVQNEPAPGRPRTRAYLEVNPGRVEGQPGADARSTRGGCKVNPGRMQGQPGADCLRPASTPSSSRPSVAARALTANR